MGKQFQKRICLWVNIQNKQGQMNLATTSSDKKCIDREQCIEVKVILPGVIKPILAKLSNYKNSANLIADEINAWISLLSG